MLNSSEIERASSAMEHSPRSPFDAHDPTTFPEKRPFGAGEYIFVSKAKPDRKIRLAVAGRGLVEQDKLLRADDLDADINLSKFKLYSVGNAADPFVVIVSSTQQDKWVRVIEGSGGFDCAAKVTAGAGSFDDHACHWRIKKLPSFAGAVVIISRLNEAFTLKAVDDGTLIGQPPGQTGDTDDVWGMVGPLEPSVACWGEPFGSFKAQSRQNTISLASIPVYEDKCSRQYPMGCFPVRVLGQVSESGIFMHADSKKKAVSACWVVKKKATRFNCWVSINESAVHDGTRGRISCVGKLTFHIFGDGNQELWKSSKVKSQADTQYVDLDVSGQTIITLKVVALDGDEGAHSVWIDPVLTLIDSSPITKNELVDPEAGVVAHKLPSYAATLTYFEKKVYGTDHPHRICEMRSNFLRLFRSYAEETWLVIKLEDAVCEFNEVTGKGFFISEPCVDEVHEFSCNSQAEACKWFCEICYSIACTSSSKPPHPPKHLLDQIPTPPRDWLSNAASWVLNDSDHRSQAVGDSLKQLVRNGDVVPQRQFWSTGPFIKPQWVIFDLQVPTDLKQFKYYTREDNSCPRECVLMYTDQLHGNAKWAIASRWHAVKKSGWSPTVNFAPRVARYWKLEIKSTFGSHEDGVVIARVNFFGSQEHKGNLEHDVDETREIDPETKASAAAIFVQMANGNKTLTRADFRRFVESQLDQTASQQTASEDISRKSMGFFKGPPPPASPDEMRVSVMNSMLLNSSDSDSDEDEDAEGSAAEGLDNEDEEDCLAFTSSPFSEFSEDTAFHAHLVQEEAATNLMRVMEPLTSNAVLVHSNEALMEMLHRSIIPAASKWHQQGGQEVFVDPTVHFQRLELILPPNRDLAFLFPWTEKHTAQIDLIVALATRHKHDFPGSRYLLLFVPTIPDWAQHHLSSVAPEVAAYMRLQPLPVLMCPVAEDVLTMSRPDITRMITREESFTQDPFNQFIAQDSVSDVLNKNAKLVSEWMQAAVLTLIKYQPEMPCTIQAKGEVSSAVLEKIMHSSEKERKNKAYRLIKMDDAVEHIVLLDRAIDPVTPQLQARTYAGALHEQYNSYQISTHTFPSRLSKSTGSVVKLSAHSTMFGVHDKVWTLLRDLSVMRAADECKTMLDDAQGLPLDSVKLLQLEGHRDILAELCGRLMAEKLPLKSGLARAAAESDQGLSIWDLAKLETGLWHDNVYANYRRPTMALLQECTKQFTLSQTLRLVILIAQTTPMGLLRDDLKQLYSWISGSYGYRSGMLLCTLEAVGMVPVETKRRAKSWQDVSVALDLSPKTRESKAFDHSSVDDEFSAYGYYTPLTMRIVQASASPALFKKVNQMLPGPGKQWLPARGSNENTAATSQTTFVIFVGGCTWGEVAAIRSLEKQTSRKYVIIACNVATGDQMIDTFVTTFKGDHVDKF